MTIRDLDNNLKYIVDSKKIESYNLLVCDTPIKGLKDVYVDVFIKPVNPANNITVEFYVEKI
jgi:hypothetical protein